MQVLDPTIVHGRPLFINQRTGERLTSCTPVRNLNPRTPVHSLKPLSVIKKKPAQAPFKGSKQKEGRQTRKVRQELTRFTQDRQRANSNTVRAIKRHQLEEAANPLRGADSLTPTQEQRQAQYVAQRAAQLARRQLDQEQGLRKVAAALHSKFPAVKLYKAQVQQQPAKPAKQPAQPVQQPAQSAQPEELEEGEVPPTFITEPAEEEQFPEVVEWNKLVKKIKKLRYGEPDWAIDYWITRARDKYCFNLSGFDPKVARIKTERHYCRHDPSPKSPEEALRNLGDGPEYTLWGLLTSSSFRAADAARAYTLQQRAHPSL